MDECSFPFNFQLLLLSDWKPSTINDTIMTYQAEIPKGVFFFLLLTGNIFLIFCTIFFFFFLGLGKLGCW